MSVPPWLDDRPDHGIDAVAYDSVTAMTTDPAVLHRACRHHNWQQSREEVRAWTALPLEASEEMCTQEFWIGMVPADGHAQGLVTLCRVAFLPASVRQGIFQATNDVALKKAVQELHDQWRDKRKLAVWLADVDELGARHAFDADHLHDVIAVLGLWHFGEVQGNRESGAVLRITYQLPEDVPLYKPDWRHGFPNFYFAVAPTGTPHGLTRSLADGRLSCKEWIVPLEQVDAEQHIIEVNWVHPPTIRDHYQLPVDYWQTVAEEIHQARLAS